MKKDKASYGETNSASDTYSFCKDIKSCFFSLEPAQLVLLASTIGIALAESLTVEQQTVVASFLSGVSQAIIITVAREELGKGGGEEEAILRQVGILKKHISALEDDLRKK